MEDNVMKAEDNVMEMEELLKSIQEYIVKLIDGCKKYLTLFNGSSDEDIDLVGLIVSIAEGIDWTYKAVVHTHPVQSNPIELDNVDDVLNTFADALENIDGALLADILEYDMIPLLEEWKDKLIA